MTRRMDAVLMIAQLPQVAAVIPAGMIDVESEIIRWDLLDHGSLSGGLKTAISWIWVVWADRTPRHPWRDPFEDFGLMEPELQRACLRAVMLRHQG